MRKFFKRNKKDVGVSGSAKTNVSSSSDSVPASIPSNDSNLQLGSRGSVASSTNSLNESIYSSYLYLDIKEKHLKDIFKAVWHDDYLKTKNILAKSRNKANSLDNKNRTPLHLACARGNQPILQQLLLCHPDVDTVDNEGSTPLVKAVQKQSELCIGMLLSMKPDVDIKDKRGCGALHYATSMRWEEGVRALLEAKADVALPDSNGNTALHLSCLSDPVSREIANLLMTFRAPINLQNNKKETPLIICAEKGDERLVHLLVEGGHADLTCKVEEGWTALDRAQMNGFHSIVEYLQNKEVELRRSMEASLSAAGTIREENEEEEEGEEGEGQSSHDVIPITTGQMNLESDEDDGENSEEPTDIENGPAVENIPPPPDEPIPWTSSDEEIQVPEPTKGGVTKTAQPKREMNSDSISLLLPAATDDQRTDTQLDADSKREKFGEKTVGSTAADVHDFGKSFSDDDSSLGLGLPKNRPKTAVGSNRKEEADIKTKDEKDEDSEWDSDDQDGLKVSAKPGNSRNGVSWNRNETSDVEEFAADGKSKTDATDNNASVISWSMDEKPLPNGVKESPSKDIDPRSSYWDSSEEETQAQEQLEKLRHVASTLKQPETKRPGFESPSNHFDFDSDGDEDKIDTKDSGKPFDDVIAGSSDVITGKYDVRDGSDDVIDEGKDVIESDNDTSEAEHDGHDNDPEKKASQRDLRVQGHLEESNAKVNQVDYDIDDNNWDSDQEDREKLPELESRNGMEAEAESGDIEVPILQESHNSSDLNLLDKSSDKPEDEKMNKCDSPFDSESESEKEEANGVDSLKNRIDKNDQSKGLTAVINSSEKMTNSQIKPQTSDDSDSNVEKDSIPEKRKDSESSEEGDENGMMVNIIGARQAKSSPGFVPKFSAGVENTLEDKTPATKTVPDPVSTDDESSQGEPTEPTSSWEIENRIKRMQKQFSVKVESEKDEEEKGEMIAVEENEEAVLEQMYHLNAAVAPEADNSFEVSNTDFDDDEVDANDVVDSTPRGVIYPSSGQESKLMAAGGGDRIPSTPVPSKNAGGPEKPLVNDPMKSDQDVAIDETEERAWKDGEVGGMKEKLLAQEAKEDKKEKKAEDGEDDDEDDSSDNMGPPTVGIGYSPRLSDITANVSSLAGSVAIKNQFREQGRLIAQEQVEKQRMERKMKAFETEVDTLSNKLQQLQKEKELTEEDEVRLKNDLKSLKQQLVDEQENRQLSEQVSAQKSNQVDKLESELERETVAKEDAERNCRQLQMQLKELSNKLKNIENRPATKLGSRRGSGSLGNNGSLPRNLLLLDETQAPETETDEVINTLEEAVIVESNPAGLHAAPAAPKNQPPMSHPPAADVPGNAFMTLAEKTVLEEKHEKELTEIKGKITEMESQLEDLKEEKNKISEDLAAEKLMKEKLMIQLDAEEARNVNNQDRADEKIRELKEKVEEKENFVKHLQGELRAKDEQISDLQEKIHSKEVQNTKLHADLDHTQQVVKAEKELLHQSHAEKLKLQSEVKLQQESMNEMYQTSIDYKRDLAIAEARLKANEDARISNESEKEDLKNKLDDLRQQLEKSAQKQSATEMKNSELSVKLSLLEREKEAEPDMEEKLSTLRDQLLESQKEQSRLTTELNSASMAKEFAVEKVANYERELENLKLEQAKLQDAFTTSLKETVTASLNAATVAAQERAQIKEEKSSAATTRPEKKSKAEDSKQELRGMAPRERTRNVDQIIEEHRKQDLQSVPLVNWYKSNDRHFAEEEPVVMAYSYNNALMAENMPYKLDGLQNELDRERQHRFNAEIDNRQLKYEANQAYADQTSLNKRMEALEKLIEERVSKASAVSSGGVVPGPVPAAPVVAAVPTVGYPPSGVGNGVVFESPNYGIDLERFKKDIEAQCRMELIEQQQKVNNYLDEQIKMRSNFEKVRTEQENALKQEYNRRISDLELEIRKYKDLYGVTIPVRDPGVVVASAMTSLGEDPELKRLHTLLEKERRQREKLESRLDRMVDRDIESRAQIAVEKQRMNDLTSSGGLGSTVGLGNQSGHVSEFDALLEKVRRQLDNSISRHLGTTKMELEMFSQHPYATRDRSFYPTNSDRISNFNPSYKF